VYRNFWEGERDESKGGGKIKALTRATIEGIWNYVEKRGDTKKE